MKITQLRCTACNGKLRLDEKHPTVAVCEYCQTTYIIHKDADENEYLTPGDLEQARSERWYVPDKKDTSPSPRWWEYYNWKRGGIATVIVLVIIIGSRWGKLTKRYEQNHNVTVANSYETGESTEETKVSIEVEAPLTGMLADMAAEVLQKSKEELKAEDLTSFKWLEVKYVEDAILVGYSLEMPSDVGEDALAWISFPKNTSDQQLKEIAKFTGLKKLEVAGYLSDTISGLQIESLTCYAHTLEEIASKVTPADIKELHILGGLQSLEGLDKFENLEKLNVYGYDVVDIKELVNLKKLKSLTIENGDSIKDFSVISLMSSLEELNIESEGIRSIDFLKNLTGLRILAINDAEVIQMDVLGEMKGLTDLSITRCGELKDLSVLEGMTTLKSLVVEVPYNCKAPDLSALHELTSLSVSHVENVDFLRKMKKLKELSLDGCKIEDAQVFANLTELRHLKCAYMSGELSNWKFVTQIPRLESLNLNGISTYEDLSSVFGMTSLQTLLLNGAECEINFASIKPNPNLKVLEMDGVKLYKNVQVSGGNGIYTVNYDKVSLDENRDFLKNFTGLTQLSVADNMLTSIDFAKELHRLEALDISKNYITDLKALEGIGALSTVDCTDNPIENYRVLSDKVALVY